MSYLKSSLIRSSQGVVVAEVVHLGVPAIAGITIVPTHPHHLNVYRASVDPDAVVLNAEGVASELVKVIEAETSHVEAFKTELNDANKRVKRQADECEKLVNQDVSSSTDLKADADLVAAAKREAAQVASWQLPTDSDGYVAARAVAGRIDCDDLATVVTPGLRKAVEAFERGLAAVENAQGRARRQYEAFTEIERKMADPSRQGAAQDLRKALAVQRQVDQLSDQLDAVRRDLRGRLDALDALAGELQQLRQQGGTQ